MGGYGYPLTHGLRRALDLMGVYWMDVRMPDRMRTCVKSEGGCYLYVDERPGCPLVALCETCLPEKLALSLDSRLERGAGEK